MQCQIVLPNVRSPPQFHNLVNFMILRLACQGEQEFGSTTLLAFNLLDYKDPAGVYEKTEDGI
jgi:hypothetical protein